MARWSEFSEQAPDLALSLARLLHQYGRGYGYLATVRADGGPRVHPVCPVLSRGGLYCFLIDSPKRRDLERDGRYALHTFPPEHSDDEGYLSGRATPVTDVDVVDRLAAEAHADPVVDWRLFEFDVEVAMVVVRDGSPVGHHGESVTRHVWRSP